MVRISVTTAGSGGVRRHLEVTAETRTEAVHLVQRRLADGETVLATIVTSDGILAPADLLLL